jgi:ATP-binding cassette subfamily F protein 3
MLNFKNIALRRGTKLLFQGANFTIHSGHKVGIIGANGVGKSSLFALICGQLQPDAGSIELPPKIVVAHVAQEIPATDRPAIEYVMDGDRELRAIQAALHQAEQAGEGETIAALHSELDAIEGYTARSRAARLLHGLGFSTIQMDNPVNTFSGGWRMRLNLAQALMCRSDLLLLDEPTNHLDLDAVIWLEDWLRAYTGTLLIISHDRDFLDRVADQIAYLDRQTVQLYSGNYSAFELRLSEDMARQQAAQQKQQQQMAHIQQFVARFRAKATKARQAQSRLKALQRMELIAPAHVNSPFHFCFREPERLPNPMLQLDDITIGYDGNPVINQVTLDIRPGDRIGLLGPNGAGKSTLIKLLAGELQPVSGKIISSQHLRAGYFSQHQLEQLHTQDSPLRHMQRLNPAATDQELRDFLGGFGFIGDVVLEPVAPLSGGEKARLVLAMLVYQNPNLLLLDEPTNHLDLEMRHAMTMALQDFTGAMVLVSHDRHLLRTACEQFLLVLEGTAKTFDGDLEDYRQWLAQRRNEDRDEASETSELQHSASARKERRRNEAEQRRRLQPLRSQVERLEKTVDKLTQQLQSLEQLLSDPALYEESAKDRLKELLLEQGRAKQALDDAEQAWMQAHEELELAERAEING